MRPKLAPKASNIFEKAVDVVFNLFFRDAVCFLDFTGLRFAIAFNFFDIVVISLALFP